MTAAHRSTVHSSARRLRSVQMITITPPTIAVANTYFALSSIPAHAPSHSASRRTGASQVRITARNRPRKHASWRISE